MVKDKEAATTVQLTKFLKIAKAFSNQYVHDVNRVRDNLKQLYFNYENDDPYSSYQELIELIEHPNHRYRVNCLASATYMAHEMRKLSIPNNVIIYSEYDENGKYVTYHAVLLYKYNGNFKVCDITYHHSRCIDNDCLLFWPYERYPELYNAMTGNFISAEKACIVDTNIRPLSKFIPYENLAEWNPLEHGLFSISKYLKKVKQDKEEEQKLWLERHQGKR